MKITTVGIDLAKNVFQVHAVNNLGKTVMNKQLRRDQMAKFFVNVPTCLIGMEACSSSHFWARKLQGMGHTVRLRDWKRCHQREAFGGGRRRQGTRDRPGPDGHATSAGRRHALPGRRRAGLAGAGPADRAAGSRGTQRLN